MNTKVYKKDFIGIINLKYIFFYLLIPVFLFFINTPNIYALSLSEHYAELFNTWGVNSFVMNYCSFNELSESKSCNEVYFPKVLPGTPDEDKNNFSQNGYYIKRVGKHLLEDYDSISPQVLLVTSSELQDIPLNDIKGFSNVVVVCNTHYNFNNNICDTNHISSSNPQDLFSINLENSFYRNLNILFFKSNNITYLFIPSNYIDLYNTRIGVLNFVVDWNRSLNAEKIYSPNRSPTNVVNVVRSSINPLFKSSIKYIFTIFVFTIIFWYFIYSYLKKDNIFGFVSVAKTMKTIHRFLNKLSSISLYIFLVLMFLYIPMFITISLRDIGSVDKSYIFNYYLNTVKPINFIMFLNNDNFFRVVMFFYSYLVFLLLAFSLVPKFVLLIEKSLKNMMVFRVKNNYIKSLFVFINIFLLLVYFFMGLKNGYLIITLALLFYIVLIYMTRDLDLSIPKLFSNKEKYILSFTSIFLVITGLLYGPFFSINTANNLIYEDLIGIDNKSPLLPYSKDYNPDSIFNDYVVKLDYPIFIDNILIYHPNFPTIINDSLENFLPNDNSFIMYSSAEYVQDFLQKIIEYPNIISKLKPSDKATNIFYVEDFNTNKDTPYFISLDVNCENLNNKTPTDVSLEFYIFSPDKSKKNRVPSSKVLNFPGCTDLKNKNYIFPIEKYFYNKNIILSFTNLSSEYIYNLQLFSGDEEIPVKFLSLDTNGNYLNIVTNPTSKVLYVYSLYIEEEIKFERDSNVYNISKALNTLKSRGLLNNPFKIWSTGTGVALENYLDKK